MPGPQCGTIRLTAQIGQHTAKDTETLEAAETGCCGLDQSPCARLGPGAQTQTAGTLQTASTQKKDKFHPYHQSTGEKGRQTWSFPFLSF
jgi:hypothetical protein